MKHFLLFYETSADYLERRAEFRDAHLRKAWNSHAAGELVLGGALKDPVDGAVLLFKAESAKVAEEFAKLRSLCPQRTGHTMAREGVDDGRRHHGCHAGHAGRLSQILDPSRTPSPIATGGAASGAQVTRRAYQSSAHQSPLYRIRRK